VDSEGATYSDQKLRIGRMGIRVGDETTLTPPHAGAVQSMLPAKTLPYVERGRNFCERFETVTVLFSDIISFTSMAALMDPLAVVNMLNELYRTYDTLVDRHNVYKVRLVYRRNML
jgi:class 3 adenylate cyclase